MRTKSLNMITEGEQTTPEGINMRPVETNKSRRDKQGHEEYTRPERTNEARRDKQNKEG